MVFRYFEARLENIQRYNRSRRNNTTYPYFRLNIEGDTHDLDKLESCVPRIWFNEYHKLPRGIRECLMGPEFKKIIKKHMYEKCQHAENKNITCDICGENRLTETIESRFLEDISELESSEDEETRITETTHDGTTFEITWDEIGSEIFSRTYQPSMQLKLIMEGLKELH